MIHINKQGVVGNKADMYVSYTSLGELDPSLAFEGGSKLAATQVEYKLVLDNKYDFSGNGDGKQTEFIGPSRWRIEEAPPEQWISVSAATSYVKGVRDSTTDSVVRSNAEKTLAALNP